MLVLCNYNNKLLKTRKKESCLTIYLRRVCSIEILTATLFISIIYFFVVLSPPNYLPINIVSCDAVDLTKSHCYTVTSPSGPRQVSVVTFCHFDSSTLILMHERIYFFTTEKLYNLNASKILIFTSFLIVERL